MFMKQYEIWMQKQLTRKRTIEDVSCYKKDSATELLSCCVRSGIRLSVTSIICILNGRSAISIMGIGISIWLSCQVVLKEI